MDSHLFCSDMRNSLFGISQTENDFVILLTVGSQENHSVHNDQILGLFLNWSRMMFRIFLDIFDNCINTQSHILDARPFSAFVFTSLKKLESLYSLKWLWFQSNTTDTGELQTLLKPHWIFKLINLIQVKKKKKRNYRRKQTDWRSTVAVLEKSTNFACKDPMSEWKNFF